MFESMYVFAEIYNRGALSPEKSITRIPDVSAWVGVQGFVAGLVFNVLGVAAVAFLSCDEKRVRRTGWAIGGALTALAMALSTI